MQGLGPSLGFRGLAQGSGFIVLLLLVGGRGGGGGGFGFMCEVWS